MSSFTSHDVYFEFVECLVHQLLCTRNMYPQYVFERRSKYGISLWQCRHEGVCQYIKKVITNSSSLVVNGVAKRFILATYDSHGQTVDHVFIDCTFTDSTGAGGDKNLDATSLCILEEQLRTSTLKTMLLDGKLATYQSDWTWALLLQCIPTGNDALLSEHLSANSQEAIDITGSSDGERGVHSMLLQEALTSGDWVTDNAQLASQILLQRQQQTAEGEGNVEAGGVLTPVVSFSNPLLDMQVGAYLFSP